MPSPKEPLRPLRLCLLAVAWLLLGHYLPDVLWHGLPRSVLDTLSLPTYSLLCQVVTTVAGLLLARLFLRHPLAALGLQRPRAIDLALTELLAPVVFVVASCVALKIAEPYLMEELATQGAGASRRNAGSFGKAVTEAPLLLTLVWGAVLAAVSEELMFRGALFGAAYEVASVLFGRLGEAARRHAAGWLAVVVAAATFGAMHADMKGSVGIVRVVATTCLGLACGTARWLGRTVVVSMLLHFTYNTISVGVGRGWFKGTSEPLLLVVPNRLLVIALAAIVGAIAIVVVRRAMRGESPETSS